ncbi:MAG: hypothetical protein GX122_02380 [Candidatus Cloacimonetes bacterium]|nr:hypothetical protein [Candidatus Cloacimonadota bacterium]NLO11249.1 hypothetical protein [Candidatus Cloacimonadota bacterium]
MVKHIIFLILLALPLCIFAQEIPEIIELDSETLSYNAWEELYNQLMLPDTQLGLDNRLWLEDDSFSLHQAYFQHDGQDLFVNYGNDWKKNLSHFNFGIGIRQNKLVEDVALGNYRLHFGSGITMGSGSKSTKGDVFRIQRAPRPDSYSPFGSAIKLHWRDFRALAFGSVLNREITQNTDGEILSLPKTRSGRADITRESLWGGALSYEAKVFRMALLGYIQGYDREFASADMDSQTKIFSAYAGVRLNEHSVDWESGQAGKNQHHFLAWNFNHQRFKQTISFAMDPDHKQITYFSSREALGRDPDTVEMAWDASFPLLKDTSMFLRASADQKRRDYISSKGMKSRLLARFGYHPKHRNLNLTISHFDKEILTKTGDDLHTSRPQHWRFELDYKDKVLPTLQLILNTRYHLEDKEGWDNNTFYWHSGIRFNKNRFGVRGGFQGWHGAKRGTIYMDDTLLAFSEAKRDDQFIYLGGDLVMNNMKLGVDLRQSLKDSSNQRAILRVGTWL